MTPHGVILAGGLASRMGGGDKGRLPLGGQEVLGHVIDRLGPQVAGLALNANGPADRFAYLGLPVIADTVPDHPGPLAGVLAGMRWAAGQGASHIVTAAADTPFLPTDLVAKLQASDPAPIALATTHSPKGRTWRHPTFGLWPVDLADDLEAALTGGMRKVMAWVDTHGTSYADFGPDDPDPFFNINTPADLDLARAMLGY